MTDQIKTYLHALYPPVQADAAYTQICTLIDKVREDISQPSALAPQDAMMFDESTVVLITYGDTLKHAGQTPLQSLHTFAKQHLTGAISDIHILPFYPYSSDDGFSVLDFYAVNPDLGTWDDVEAIGVDFGLMFDAVFNHMSAQSVWFQRWLADDPEFAGLFMTESPSTDLSAITRPRATPLLTAFDKPDGTVVHAWTTFSADQVDFDARAPQTVLRLLAILLFYVEKGARLIRLDAIAYLWKVVGTSSIHLPQTHIVIKLMRAVLDAVAPEVIIITETNVPHAENISYFGDGHDEAQMVYNFTLPPLLFNTLLTGDASKFSDWVRSLAAPSDRTTFFNFTASHDGVGVRPVEGILNPDELALMVERVRATGGRVNFKRNSDGSESPYELNVTYVDAIAGTNAPQDEQIKRFLLSQTIAMSLAGVPAIYIHSLIGSRNDLQGMARTGHNRTINRAKLERITVEAQLQDVDSFRAQVFHEYVRRLEIRRGEPAFHPNAAQAVIDIGNTGIFALLRTALDGEQRILAIYNVTEKSQVVDLSTHYVRAARDLLSDTDYSSSFTLEPYQAVWLRLL